jgi:hypothetical protein
MWGLDDVQRWTDVVADSLESWFAEMIEIILPSLYDAF